MWEDIKFWLAREVVQMVFALVVIAIAIIILSLRKDASKYD